MSVASSELFEAAPDRRAVLLGGWLAALAAVSAWVTPRGGRSLDVEEVAALAPPLVGGWRRSDGLDVVPETAGADTERSDRTLTYTYVAGEERAVMMLISYHGARSLEIKVHRPEVCYEVAGFRVTEAHDAAIPLAPSLAVPGRSFHAHRNDRDEQVLYWTRLGSAFPQTLSEQRLAGLRAGLAGRAMDGLLVRLSVVAALDEPSTLNVLRRFAAGLYGALDPRARTVLV